MARRADIRCGRTTSSVNYAGAGTKYVVKTLSGVLYHVYIDAASDVQFEKSTDKGLTWSDPTVIFTGTTTGLSVCYDRDCGVASDFIQVAYTENVGHLVLHRNIDTATADALSTQTTVFTGVSAVQNGSFLSLTRTRGGDLKAVGCIDAGTELFASKSEDNGATWSAIDTTTFPAVGTTDQIIMLPSWNADDQDAMGFFWDASANELFRLLYDDSGDTWSSTSIAASMTDSPAATSGFPHFAAAVDIANTRNLLVAWSAVDTANADLRCWTVTEAAITETATNVVLNSTDDQGLCAIGIDTELSHWYVFYVGKSDGSETFSTSVNVYYKVSTDAGATWGAETQLSSGLRSVPHLICTPRFTGQFAAISQHAATLPEFRCSASTHHPRVNFQVGL